jgi:hypothetical protein
VLFNLLGKELHTHARVVWTMIVSVYMNTFGLHKLGRKMSSPVMLWMKGMRVSRHAFPVAANNIPAHNTHTFLPK